MHLGDSMGNGCLVRLSTRRMSPQWPALQLAHQPRYQRSVRELESTLADVDGTVQSVVICSLFFNLAQPTCEHPHREFADL